MSKLTLREATEKLSALAGPGYSVNMSIESWVHDNARDQPAVIRLSVYYVQAGSMGTEPGEHIVQGATSISEAYGIATAVIASRQNTAQSAPGDDVTDDEATGGEEATA